MTARERALALRASGWLLAAHVLVRLLPLSIWLRWLRRIPTRRAPSITAPECGLALRRADLVVPFASCLVHAAAGAALLRRERQPATLTFHVAVDRSRAFEAHAVVRSGADVVTGEADAMHWPIIFRTDI